MGYPSKPLSRNPDVGFFDDEDTQHVVAKVASTNRLTIFTGAGIAADLKIPNWSTLVARLLETLEHPRHTDDEDCRSTVGFALDFFHQMPTASIVDALYRERYAHDAIEQRNRDIADILYPRDGQRAHQWVPEEALAIYVLRLAVAKRLAGCDVHIVTTNYDDSLERIADSHKETLSDLGSEGVRVFSNSDATDNGPVEGVPVSHVHGLIPRAGPGRHVVFAEREYIAWDRESKWRDYLIKRFSGGGVTVFVGASLRDYNIAAMIQRFSNGEAYALLPVEDEIAHWSKNDGNVKHDKKWPESTARYATLRGLHLGVSVLRPDFYGQVCQFLNEAAIPPYLKVPSYSTRLRNWWRSWDGQNPYEIDVLIDRCKRLREFAKAEHGALIGVEHVKAEVWVRQDPDTRELRLYSTSQTVVLPGDGYWAHCTKIQHQSRYHAAVSAFASRGTTQGRVNYRNDGRWTHFLAVPIILPEAPHFELPVGVMILLLHAPAVRDDGYFGDAESGHMRALAVRMKELGQEFLRPASAS